MSPRWSILFFFGTLLFEAGPAFALPMVLNSGADVNVAICPSPLWPKSLGAQVSFMTSQYEPVLGRWLYDGFFYEGHRYPNPNPDLELEFHFRPDGVSRLYWERADEEGFCERLADYAIEGDLLRQKVTWVNPANASTCASDPDMRPGQQTVVPFEIKGDELWLNIGLSGKDFFYILKARGEEPVAPNAASGF